MDNLTGLRVAILITAGFEQVEMLRPRETLDDAGAKTSIVSPKLQHVRSWDFGSGVTSFLSMFLWIVPTLATLTRFCCRAES